MQYFANENSIRIFHFRQDRLAVLADKLDEIRRQANDVRTQSESLHAALLAEEWNAALALADKLLIIAPDLKLAHEARQKAWAQAGANMSDSRPHAATPAWPVSTTSEIAPKQAGIRFMLWVDAVGGFLVCLADEIWIGQAGAGNAWSTLSADPARDRNCPRGQ